MATNDGGPAFPGEYVQHAPGEVGNQVAIMGQSSGMTLHDWYVGQALVGVLANSSGHYARDVADARMYADLVMKAREVLREVKP